MEKQPIPKHEALEMLASIHPQIHAALDHGAFKSRAYFESEGTKLERSLQSMLVRYHAKIQLQNNFPDVIFDQLSLCGISLLCKNLVWKGRIVPCRLRLWKSLSNELPPPGDSDGKRVFYTQPQMVLFDGSPNEADDVQETKFAILWNLNGQGLLQPLWLVCPRSFNRRTGEITVWWDIQIPDPALAVKATKPARKREDLPIQSKKSEESNN
jgi:hypothetical protein